MKLIDESYSAINREDQRLIFNKLFDIAAENVWSINVTPSPPFPVVVKTIFKNVPYNAAYSGFFLTPSNAGMETYYFEKPYNSPGTLAQMKKELIEITPASYGSSQDDPTSSSNETHGMAYKKTVFRCCRLRNNIDRDTASLYRQATTHHGSDSSHYLDDLFCYHSAATGNYIDTKL